LTSPCRGRNVPALEFVERLIDDVFPPIGYTEGDRRANEAMPRDWFNWGDDA